MTERISNDAGAHRGSGFRERVERAIRMTERLNASPYDDRAAIRHAWSELTGQREDETSI